MKCACGATGMSSHAIARRVRGCPAGGSDHPYDPADLKRCVEFCEDRLITADDLRTHMTDVSDTWAAMVDAWEEIASLLKEEIAEGTGMAPRTYARMRELRHAS